MLRVREHERDEFPSRDRSVSRHGVVGCVQAAPERNVTVTERPASAARVPVACSHMLIGSGLSCANSMSPSGRRVP